MWGEFDVNTTASAAMLEVYKHSLCYSSLTSCKLICLELA